MVACYLAECGCQLTSSTALDIRYLLAVGSVGGNVGTSPNEFVKSKKYAFSSVLSLYSTLCCLHGTSLAFLWWLH